RNPPGRSRQRASRYVLRPGVGPRCAPDAFMALISTLQYFTEVTGLDLAAHRVPGRVVPLPKVAVCYRESEESGQERELQNHPCGDPTRPAPALAHGPVLRERSDDDKRQEYRTGGQEHNQRRPTRGPFEESCPFAGRSGLAEEEKDHHHCG